MSLVINIFSGLALISTKFQSPMELNVFSNNIKQFHL